MSKYIKADTSGWPDWLENGPVKCKVWNNREEECHEDWICFYHKRTTYKYRGINSPWENSEPILSPEAEKGEQVLCWDREDDYAMVSEYLTDGIVIGVSGDGLNFDTIVKFDETHYRKSLEIDQIEKRKCVYYKKHSKA